MWQMLAASAGLNLLSGLANHGAEKAQYKVQKAWQAYSNKMIDLSSGEALNSITTNQIFNREASAAQGQAIRVGGMLSQARQEVAAAAAGVKGRSVNQAVFDVQRNAEVAESNRQRELINANLGFDAQRKNTVLQAKMSKDNTYLPKPSAASAILGAGIDTLKFGLSMGSGSGGSKGSSSVSDYISNLFS